MAFTERFEYKLEIIPPYSIIQCRQADIVEKDGVEIGRSYLRTTYCPGADVSEAPQEVQDVAGALWTAAVIDAYKKSLEDQQLQDSALETESEAA